MNLMDLPSVPLQAILEELVRSSKRHRAYRYRMVNSNGLLAIQVVFDQTLSHRTRVLCTRNLASDGSIQPRLRRAEGSMRECNAGPD